MSLRPHRLVAAAAAVALGAAFVPASQAAEPGSQCVPLHHVKQRIVEKSAQSIGEVRRFIDVAGHRIYGVTMDDVAQNIDQWNARAHCAQTTAELRAATPQLAAAKTPD